MPDTALRICYRFGPFQLDPAERLLLKDGVPVALTRKAFDTLLYLVGHGSRLVSRDELIRAVWPDAIVEEGNLHWVISTLRKALGSPGRGEEALIQTVHGVGYRFRGPVEVDGVEPEAAVQIPPAAGEPLTAVPVPPLPPVLDEGSPAGARHRWIAAAGVAALFLLLTGGIWGTGRLLGSAGGSSKAEELHSAGLRAWHAGDPLGAKRLLRDSVASDPSFAPARAALARVLTELGEETAAEREALEALRAAKGLPEDQLLEVEAAYYVSVRRWDEAIERHRRLWRKHPRDIRLGLALARVLLQKGRAAEALATIAEIRRSNARERNDPWLVLAEADAAAKAGDFPRSLRAATAAERAGGSAYLRAQAQLRQVAAWYSLQKPEPAEAAVVRAQQTASAVPVPALRARILLIGGAVRLLAGDLDGASARYEESFTLFARQGTRSVLPHTLVHLARVSLLRGDLGGAEARYQRALALCVEQRAVDCQAESQTELGHIALSRGDLPAAREHFELSRKIQTGAVDPVLANRALSGLLHISDSLGDMAAAERWAREKRALNRRYHRAWNVFSDEIVIAQYCNQQGRPQEALDLLRDAEERPEVASFVELRASALGVRALALLRLRRRGEADAASRQAVELLRRTDNVYTEVAVLAGRAAVLRGLDRLPEARETTDSLLARARVARLEVWEMEGRLLAGDIALASGDRRVGAQILRDLAAEARLKSQLRIARQAEALLRRGTGA